MKGDVLDNVVLRLDQILKINRISRKYFSISGIFLQKGSIFLTFDAKYDMLKACQGERLTLKILIGLTKS